MNNRRFVFLTFGVLSTAVVVAGCGGSSSKSSSDPGSNSSTSSASGSGDKAVFCQANLDLTNAFKGATSPDDLVKLVKANISKIDDFGAKAPADIKTDAQTLVDAAKAALSSNSPTPLETPAVSAAGPKVDSYCGQAPTASSQAPGTSGPVASTPTT